MEHIHKYLRVINMKRQPGKEDYTVYKCVVPGCTHFQRKELLEGNFAVCWACNLQMTLTKESLNRKKPIHFDCRKTRVSRAA